jgi:Protein of unknown function (DUF1116)
VRKEIEMTTATGQHTYAHSLRQTANEEALRRFTESEPVLADIRAAGEVVPGMNANTILTSGAPQDWDAYVGGQRDAVLFGALYEGLAADMEEADAKLKRGEIELGTCHAHGCIGSVAGIYTASMPVLVVENAPFGTTGFCNLYEGASRRRLNYGVYDEEVRDGLKFLEQVIGPVLGATVRQAGGVPLVPMMRRALHLGDELHSRNTAATIAFTRELAPHLLDLALDGAISRQDAQRTLAFLQENDYFFLRISMAASKAIADAAHGIEHSSLMTAMTISCNDFAIRVSGLGDRWFKGPHPVVEAKLFEPYTHDDIEWIGGESCITETVGLGGFAQVAAFALQSYQGGSPQEMARVNEMMYLVTAGEHRQFRLPYFGYRGTPVGIDIAKVVETGVLPVIDGGLAGRGGGQIGAGILKAPYECFAQAWSAYLDQYGSPERAG